MSRDTQPLPAIHELPVNSTALDTSPLGATGSAKTKTRARAPRSAGASPRSKTTAPRLSNGTYARIAGTYWRSDGKGWELRKSGGANDADKDRYLGRLSYGAWEKMKQNFSGEELAEALFDWATDKAAKKGIEL